METVQIGVKVIQTCLTPHFRIWLGKYILHLQLSGFSPRLFPWVSLLYRPTVQWHSAVFLKGYADQKSRTLFASGCFLEILHGEVINCNSCWITNCSKNMCLVLFPDEILWFSWNLCWGNLPPKIKTSYPHLQSAQCGLLLCLHWIPWALINHFSSRLGWCLTPHTPSWNTCPNIGCSIFNVQVQ